MLAVLGALVANGLITVPKFIGAGVTGSSGVMAADPPVRGRIRPAILDHLNVCSVVEPPPPHPAPEQPLINAHVNFRGPWPSEPIPQRIG